MVMSEQQASLTVENLTAGYGSLEVLSALNLRVDAGEVVGLVGPNGAGKSTLLKVLVGELQANTGHVEFGPANGHPPCLRIAQEPDLPPYLSLLELVCLGLRAWKSDDAPEDTARALLTAWGLESKTDRPLRLASPGEVRRALFALVEGIRPRLLLLDEALSALDPAVLLRAKDLLDDLSREGCATIIVTHDMGLAEHLPQKVMLLHAGSIRNSWTHHEIQQARSSGTSLLDLFLKTTTG